ncbi:phospholipase A2-like [Aulostomus maculatus]
MLSRVLIFLPAAMNVTSPLLLLLLTACMVGAARLPKALWQFAETIQCAQPGVKPLDYNDYGCWCGFGGKGTPLDAVDTCCHAHDKCYERSRKAPGCTSLASFPYVLVYDFNCTDNQVTCSDTNNKCQAAVCECDRVAAHCFAEATYNPDYKNVDPKVHCVN